MTPNVKVAVLNDYPTVVGGAERFLDQLFQLSTSGGVVFETLDLSAFLPLVRPMWGGILHSRYCRVKVFPAVVRSLQDHIVRMAPDVIHLNNNNLLTNSVQHALRDTGLPVFAFLHDGYALRRLQSPWYRTYADSFTYLTHTAEVHRQLRILNLQGHLVRVPFDMQKWAASQSMVSHEKRSDLVFVGRLERHKGIFLLLDAMVRIRRIIPNITLTIIGDGSQRRPIERKINTMGLTSQIQLKGWQSDEALHTSYREARLLILPSPDETLGYVGLEAQACGTPVMAFHNPGTERWCIDNVNGFLVYPHTAEKLAERILKILPDDVLLRRISDAALDQIRLARYDSSQVDITDIYKATSRW